MSTPKRPLDEGTIDAVGKLADIYDFSLGDALEKLSLAPPRKKALKNPPVPPPNMLLPFCGEIVPSWCHGVRFNRGLFTQCSNVPVDQGTALCTTCAKVGTRPVSCGNITERGDPNWRDRRGRRPVKYSVLVAKHKLNRADAEAEAARLGWSIPESEFDDRGAPRRGRPPKEKPIVSSVGNSLLDELVEGARALTIESAEETQEARMYRLFGSDSDEEPDASFPVESIFIDTKEYLYRRDTATVYDLHTQSQVGTLSSDGKLVST